MKSLRLFVAVAALIMGTSAMAQKPTYVNRNGDERFGNNLTTVDSTLRFVDSVTIKNDEGGFIEVSVIGYAKDTAYIVTGKKLVRFNKRRGTLTMATPVDDLAVVTDAALGTATWDLVASNGKIYVRVKGKQGLSITWCSLVKRKSVSYP